LEKLSFPVCDDWSLIRNINGDAIDGIADHYPDFAIPVAVCVVDQLLEYLADCGR
jgi:hypothetical protein